MLLQKRCRQAIDINCSYIQKMRNELEMIYNNKRLLSTVLIVSIVLDNGLKKTTNFLLFWDGCYM